MNMTECGYQLPVKEQFNAENLRRKRNADALERMHGVLNRWKEESNCSFVIMEAGPTMHHDDLQFELGFHLTIRALDFESVKHFNSVLKEVAESFPSLINFSVSSSAGTQGIRTLTVCTDRFRRD
jgi:hypothetical protein